MTDNDSSGLGIDRDDVIDQAFEDLVHDDLEGFMLVTSIDGNLQGTSFSPRYENPEEFDDSEICHLPLMELLGASIAEVALEYGLPPEDVADIGVHVTVDHLGVDSEATKESWREMLESDDTNREASQEEYEKVVAALRDFKESVRE